MVWFCLSGECDVQWHRGIRVSVCRTWSRSSEHSRVLQSLLDCWSIMLPEYVAKHLPWFGEKFYFDRYQYQDDWYFNCWAHCWGEPRWQTSTNTMQETCWLPSIILHSIHIMQLCTVAATIDSEPSAEAHFTRARICMCKVWECQHQLHSCFLKRSYWFIVECFHTYVKNIIHY